MDGATVLREDSRGTSGCGEDPEKEERHYVGTVGDFRPLRGMKRKCPVYPDAMPSTEIGVCKVRYHLILFQGMFSGVHMP
jgi:hypothetical protein